MHKKHATHTDTLKMGHPIFSIWFEQRHIIITEIFEIIFQRRDIDRRSLKDNLKNDTFTCFIRNLVFCDQLKLMETSKQKKRKASNHGNTEKATRSQNSKIYNCSTLPAKDREFLLDNPLKITAHSSTIITRQQDRINSCSISSGMQK